MSGLPTYKFIVVGSSGVGKTAILKRLVEDTFTDDSLSTIGVEFDSTVVTVDNRKVKLQIWDTAGQERFRAIAKAYYRNAAGVFVVYDLTDRRSFDDLNSWMGDIHALCDANAVIQLIGNKADLASRRVVTVAEAERFAGHHHIMYMETSAKLGANIREAFVKVTAAILGKKSGQAPPTPTANQSPLLPTAPPTGAEPEKSCC
jgi:small GTP-binding protein